MGLWMKTKSNRMSGRTRNAHGKLSFVLILFLVIGSICMSGAAGPGIVKAGASEVFTSERTKTRNTDDKKKDARYKRDSDGIWRLKDNRSLLERVKNMMKQVKYSPDIVRADNGSILLSTTKTVMHGIAEYALKAVEQGTVKSAVCVFVGDIMCLKGQQYAAQKGSSYDFYPSYAYVSDIFKNADFACGNLETLLSGSNPITKDMVNAANGQPQCNGPKILLEALRKAGLDMLVTANNHTCDWGAEGITETKEQLDSYGFANVGTHYYKKDPEEAGERFSIFEVNGINVAVLSYTHVQNQRGYLSSKEMDTMVHLFDRETVSADIEEARKLGADFIAVYCHWGIENTEALNSAQINDSLFLAEAGADLIIGSHPHCLQKCEYITNSSGKEVLCMYSMGNFCSSMARDINNDTIILRVELNGRTDNSSKVISSSASYIPCRVTSMDGQNCIVVPVSKKLNGGYSSGVLTAAHDRIAKIMNGIIPEYE